MRGRAHNLHVKRQVLPILSSILGGGGGGTILPTLTLPGPLASITSILPIPSLSLPGSVTTMTTDLPSPSSLSSSTVVSIESSTFSTTPSSASSFETSATPTPTVTPTTTIQSVFETTSGGTVHTVTTFEDSTPSATQSVIPPPAPKSFLQNKVLSGVVFALVGIVGLAIILAIATFAIRRKRNNRLMKDAISFDPTSMTDNHHYGIGEDRRSFEKRSVLTRSSNDHPSASGNAENGGYPMSGARAYGEGLGYGRDLNPTPVDGYPYPKPPPALVHEYAHGPDRALPVFPRSEGINWGPGLTPFTAPSGSPEPHFDERVQSQGRLLKVTNN